MRSIHHLYFCAIYCHMGDANRERFHREFIKRFTLTNALLLWRFCTVHKVLFTAYSVIPLVSVLNVASDWTLRHSVMCDVYMGKTREKKWCVVFFFFIIVIDLWYSVCMSVYKQTVWAVGHMSAFWPEACRFISGNTLFKAFICNAL